MRKSTNYWVCVAVDPFIQNANDHVLAAEPVGPNPVDSEKSPDLVNRRQRCERSAIQPASCWGHVKISGRRSLVCGCRTLRGRDIVEQRQL